MYIVYTDVNLRALRFKSLWAFFLNDPQFYGKRLHVMTSQFLSLFVAAMTCHSSENGAEYAGHVSFTRLGRPCIDWNHVTPPHGFHDTTIYDHENYCRNLDGTRDRPWCYTSDKLEWEYCDIPRCKGICFTCFNHIVWRIEAETNGHHITDGIFKCIF